MNCPDCESHNELLDFDVSHEMNKLIKSVTFWLKHQRITEGNLFLFFGGSPHFYEYDTIKKVGEQKEFPIDLSELEPFKCMCGSTEVNTSEVDEGIIACECEICHHEWDQEDES